MATQAYFQQINNEGFTCEIKDNIMYGLTNQEVCEIYKLSKQNESFTRLS